MAISISARIRNALVGLSLALCLLFSMLTFLLVYVIEDQIFVNQIKLEKQHYEQIIDVSPWQARNLNIALHLTVDDLPTVLPEAFRAKLLQRSGVHEYFDEDNAMFIAHFKRPDTGLPYFLVYNVRELLAVRKSTLTLFMAIGIASLLIASLAILISQWLTRSTLAPVTKLSHELRNSDIDDAVIELANEFSDDEVGVLAHALATALGRAQDSVQRELEFNRGVSHELRSPIQVAQSTAELLEISASDTQQKPIQRLKRSVTEMNEIVETFLWLASDRHVDSTDYGDIASLLQLTANLMHCRPNVDIIADTDLPRSYEYPLPRQVLSVVLRNLINNAISHSTEERIHVQFSDKLLSVSNQVNPNKESPSSFGMGLAIVQRICDRFDCNLSLKTSTLKNRTQEDQWQQQDKPLIFRAEIHWPGKK